MWPFFEPTTRVFEVGPLFPGTKFVRDGRRLIHCRNLKPFFNWLCYLLTIKHLVIKRFHYVNPKRRTKWTYQELPSTVQQDGRDSFMRCDTKGALFYELLSSWQIVAAHGEKWFLWCIKKAFFLVKSRNLIVDITAGQWRTWRGATNNQGVEMDSTTFIVFPRFLNRRKYFFPSLSLH